MLATAVVALAALVSVAHADCAGNGGTQAMYQQCAGIGWTGGTTCVSGAECVYQNDWYSQCIPCKTTTTGTTTTTQTTTTTTTTSTSSSPTTTPSGAIKYWFSFGDSYTQTGFNASSTQPSIGNVFGNPPYPGWTACGSTVPNWLDLALVTYNSTVKFGYNLAAGGATIDTALVPPYQSGIPSLIDQVTQFQNAYTSNGKPGGQLAGWTGANSFVSIWIGINDIGNSWYQSGDRGAFNNQLLDAYFAQVTKLYGFGARNFVFLNVPPIDRSPLMLSQTGVDGEKVVITDFNTKLATRAASFASSNSGAKTYVVDTNALIVKLLNSPTTYGFVDATSYGSATNQMWCNNYHISPGVHDYVAKELKTKLAGTGAP